jgi:hypothetical protein
MYMEALEFLEDERESWRPYEALADLPDEALTTATEADSAAHGWTGRDLMIHMASGREVALQIARELAVNETSEARARWDREWEALGGDAVNARIFEEWRDVPLDEVRKRFRDVPGELRGYLTVVPETRWIKNADVQKTFVEETMEHDDDHRADLAAILEIAAAQSV